MSTFLIKKLFTRTLYRAILKLKRGDLMGFSEELKKESQELKAVKRPYETAAFLIFAIMLFQQLAFWVIRLNKFRKDIKAAAGAWNPSFNTNLPTTPAFVIRIIQIDATKWLYVLLGLIGLALWYFLIYLFVWNYCKKRKLAKWTWTVLIAFLPVNILFIPAYIFYAVYVFRPYFFRFIKRMVEEYKAYNPSIPFPEEVEEELVAENKEEFEEELAEDQAQEQKQE